MAPDSDAPRTPIAIAAAVVMIAQQVGAKAARDALFLGNFPSSDLPKIMIAAAVLGGAAVFALARAYERWSPARLVPWAFGLNALLFFLEWSLGGMFPAAVAVALYLHVAMLGAAVISGFWSVINERYDPHAAKRAVARIAAGATLGGVLGAVLTERVSAVFDVNAVLFALAVLNSCCAVLVRIVGRGSHFSRSEEGETRPPVETLQRNPYLQRIAWLVVVVSFVGTMLDFAFKAEAGARLGTEAELASFFAVFYTVTSLTGFVLQAAVSSRALERLGLERTLAVLPWCVMALSVLGAGFARLWTLALLRGAEWALEGSLFRSGYELLYVPVPAIEKRSTKVIIDVGFRRAGDLLGSGAVLFVVAILPEQAIGFVVVAAGVLSLFVLRSIRSVYRGYVAQLAAGLAAGSINQANASLDPTTRRLVTETLMIDRDALLARVAEMNRPNDSHERARVRRELDDGAVDIKRVREYIELLADPEFTVLVVEALRTVAPKVTGQLVDTLLNQEEPQVIRQQIPSILTAGERKRAVEGLVQALDDPSFRIRVAAATALEALGREGLDVDLSAPRVFGLIEREIDAGVRTWDTKIRASERVLVPQDQDLVIDPTQRGLDHVFNLLGFVVDREVLHRARRALKGSDPRLRGTALEYLENVLPDTVRTKLWPYVGGPIKRSPGARSRAELIEELEKLS
ncbi:MAG: hypothetical protein AAF500_05295 [Myxococcota bacterium]